MVSREAVGFALGDLISGIQSINYLSPTVHVSVRPSMSGESHRKRIGRKRKGKDKAKQKPLLNKQASLRRKKVQLARLQAEVEQLEREEAARKQGVTARVSTRTKRVREEASAEESTPHRTKLDEAERRVVIKHFFKKLGSPPEEDWDNPSKYGRYGAGTPVALSETLQYTWRFHPEPWRIVEDVTCWPTTIDLIIQHEGGVVPDALIQHAGCSRTKRKGTGDVRSIRPNPEISEVARKRQRELRSQARDLARAQGTQA